MADRAYITPKVFKWARESAKMSVNIAASKVAVPVERFKEWEKGESYPTIRQAQKLAKVYRRPFAIFFLPDIPKDFQPLQDFRKKGSKELSTSAIFIIRDIQEKQAWIREINIDNNESASVFVGKYGINDNPVDVAEDILKTLGINPLNYRSTNPILEWIDKAESVGIFISRTSFIHSRLKLDADEIQGFAIADKFAPFVFINSDDWNSAQFFTLVHELAHLWIAESGISNNIEHLEKKQGLFDPIEIFSNEVAANALMPNEFMYSIPTDTFQYPPEIFKVAKMMGVSTYALLVRALNLKIISYNLYKKLQLEADHEFNKFLEREETKKAKFKEKSGGPNYFLLQINRNSRLFTQKVLDAFRGDNIEATQASSLLNVKINKFSLLEAQMYR